jgi:DNA polymerase-3 subunit alpha
MKLHVSPPDINKSAYFFNVIDEQHLMHGLGAIKGVGEAAIENIVAARLQDGEFKDLFDFCSRVDLRKTNRRVLEALIKSGCFDLLGTHRASLMASVNLALQHAEQSLHAQTHGQHDLLGMNTQSTKPRYVEAANWQDEIQLQGEKETLGFYLTGHPLRRYLNELSNFTTCRLAELHPSDHKAGRVAGIVTNIRVRQTKRGDRIGIFTLDDGTSQLEVVCFSECFQKYRHLMTEDQMVIVEGEIGIDDFSNSTRILARDLFTIEQARDRFAKQLRINLPCLQKFDVANLQHLLEKHIGGNCGVIIRYLHENIQADIRLGKNLFVKPSDALLKLIQEQLAVEHVELVY